MSPFQVVYGFEAQLLVTLELPTLHLMKAIEDARFTNSLDKRIMYLQKLNEEKLQVVNRISTHQLKVKSLFDTKAKPRTFQVGNNVLLWDKRHEPQGSHGKFYSLWLGHFKIRHFASQNSFYLDYMDGSTLPLPYCGKFLKLFKTQEFWRPLCTFCIAFCFQFFLFLFFSLCALSSELILFFESFPQWIRKLSVHPQNYLWFLILYISSAKSSPEGASCCPLNSPLFLKSNFMKIEVFSWRNSCFEPLKCSF